MFQVGENIRVRLVEGTQLSGIIAAVSPEILTILADSSPQGYYRIPYSSLAFVFSNDLPKPITREERHNYPQEVS